MMPILTFNMKFKSANLSLFCGFERNIVVSLNFFCKNLDKHIRMSYFYINFAVDKTIHRTNE